MENELDYLQAEDVQYASYEMLQNVAALEHMESCIVALESLQTFFDNTPSPSLEQLALADVVMDNVTQGTDLTPEDVVPSLESYVGTQVSTENLRDTVVKYYHQVMEFIKRIYASFKAFLIKFFDDLEPLKEKFENLLILLGTKSSNRPRDNVMVGPSLRKLAVNYKLPRGYDELVRPLGVMRAVSETILEDHALRVSELADRLTKTRFDKDDDSLDTLIKANQTVARSLLPILRLFPEPVQVGNYNHATATMFNNTAVLANIELPEYGGATYSEAEEIDFATKFRSMSFKVGSVESGEIKANYGFDFKERAGALLMEQMSAKELSLLCSNAIDILKVLLRYRDSYQSKLERQAKESQRAANDVAKVLDGRAKFVADGSQQITSLPALKAVLGYHSAIAKWSIEPFTGLMLYNASTLKTLYTVLTLHTANLE